MSKPSTNSNVRKYWTPGVCLALASPYLQIVLIRLWQSRGGVTLLQHLHIHLRSNTCQGVVQKQNHILTLTHSVLYLPRCSVHCTTVVTLLHSYTRLQLIVLDSHLGLNTFPGATHSGLSTSHTVPWPRSQSWWPAAPLSSPGPIKSRSNYKIWVSKIWKVLESNRWHAFVVCDGPISV